MQITTIGLDLAKSVFKSTALMRLVRSLFASRFDGHRCCHSSPNCLLAWLAWRLADAASLGA